MATKKLSVKKSFSGDRPTQVMLMPNSIFKKRPTLVENYRRVAILPTIGKLFKSIVCARLTADLSGTLWNVHHGLRKGRST